MSQLALFDPTTRPPKVKKNAVLSPCQTWRYTLTREWDPDQPGLLLIMLNPSTADHQINDRTIDRCITFAHTWGCGMITVVNLFSFRATKPKDLIAQTKAGFDTVGPDNDKHIRAQLALHQGKDDLIVAGWGATALHKLLKPRRDLVVQMLPLLDVQCLAETDGGEPGHPLYIDGETALQTWRGIVGA